MDEIVLAREQIVEKNDNFPNQKFVDYNFMPMPRPYEIDPYAEAEKEIKQEVESESEEENLDQQKPQEPIFLNVLVNHDKNRNVHGEAMRGQLCRACLSEFSKPPGIGRKVICFHLEDLEYHYQKAIETQRALNCSNGCVPNCPGHASSSTLTRGRKKKKRYVPEGINITHDDIRTDNSLVYQEGKDDDEEEEKEKTGKKKKGTKTRRKEEVDSKTKQKRRRCCWRDLLDPDHLNCTDVNTCQYCGHKSDTELAAIKHRRTLHSIGDPYSCKKCDFSSLSFVVFMDHLRNDSCLYQSEQDKPQDPVLKKTQKKPRRAKSSRKRRL